jgi:uncharacterized protein (DUF1330 family)
MWSALGFPWLMRVFHEVEADPSNPAVLAGEVMMPKGYVLAEVDVTDPALFDTYRPLAAAAIAAFGGRYLVRGGATETLEGERKLSRVVLLEFPSPERAMEWYRSAQYQDALAIRLKAATTELFMVTGHDG